MPPKSDEVTLAWASAMPSCSTEKSLIKSYAPRSYPHTPEQIAEEIRVDGEGRLWWKKQIDGKGPQRKLNKPVGRLSIRGYRQVWFKGPHYTGHSIAFCLYYGRWPVANKEIDHINGIKTDNSKENLREVYNSVNARNKHKLISSNTSGYNGVSWNSRYKHWRATIQVNGKQIHKHFASLAEAIACRVDWEKKYNFTPISPSKINPLI